MTNGTESDIILPMLKELCGGFLNLVYPINCHICRNKLDPDNTYHLCIECLSKIRLNPPPYCRGCGRSFAGTDICNECRLNKHHFDEVYSAGLYEGVLKECVHLFKYNRKLVMRKLLGKLLIDFARSHINMEKFDFLVPVPLSGVKLRARQFNQSEMLAGEMNKVFKLPVVNNRLKRVKITPSQIELPRKKRLKNVEGAFAVHGNSYFKDKNILLLDDVLTTGATVNECARILKSAGTNSVAVLTLARGA